MPDDPYMTPAEFAQLPVAVQHAVWAAATERRIDSVARSSDRPRRYDRGQVQAIAAGLEASR